MEKKSINKQEFVKGAKIAGIGIASVLMEVAVGGIIGWAIGWAAGEAMEKVKEGK